MIPRMPRYGRLRWHGSGPGFRSMFGTVRRSRLRWFRFPLGYWFRAFASQRPNAYRVYLLVEAVGRPSRH